MLAARAFFVPCAPLRERSSEVLWGLVDIPGHQTSPHPCARGVVRAHCCATGGDQCRLRLGRFFRAPQWVILFWAPFWAPFLKTPFGPPKIHIFWVVNGVFMGPKKHKIEFPVVIYIIIGVFTFFRFAVFKKWHAKKTKNDTPKNLKSPKILSEKMGFGKRSWKKEH